MRPYISNKKGIIRMGLLFLSLLVVSACATKQDIHYLNSQIVALDKRVDRLQESVAEMAAEIDTVRADMQKLSGRLEENGRLIKRAIEKDTTKEDTYKTGLERIADLRARVRQLEAFLKLEPSGGPEGRYVEDDTKEFKGPGGQLQRPEEKALSPEKRLYDLNLAAFQEGNYEQALDGFKDFLNKHPKSDLADNALFWIGESYTALGEYERAILAYQELIKKYPKGNKAPSAMLRQALAFHEINDKKSSRLLLKKVIKNYPNSSEAKIAKAKLKTMK